MSQRYSGISFALLMLKVFKNIKVAFVFKISIISSIQNAVTVISL